MAKEAAEIAHKDAIVQKKKEQAPKRASEEAEKAGRALKTRQSQGYTRNQRRDGSDGQNRSAFVYYITYLSYSDRFYLKRKRQRRNVELFTEYADAKCQAFLLLCCYCALHFAPVML